VREYGVKYVDLQGNYIIFDGFPDLSNSPKLTCLRIDNPKFFLFGIRVGDNITIVDSIMKENGYRRKQTDDDYEYYKGKIDISFRLDRMDTGNGIMKTIKAFRISIRSTDWFHKGYYK